MVEQMKELSNDSDGTDYRTGFLIWVALDLVLMAGIVLVGLS